MGLVKNLRARIARILQPAAYHGGGPPVHSDGSKFPGGLPSRWRNSRLNHKAIRRNARAALQDSAPARAIVERKVDAIAHTGLQLEPTPDGEMLGMTKDAAADWGRDVGGRFRLWAKDKKQHRAGSLTFNQAQWSYSFFKERENDIFVRLQYSKEKSLQNPLQFSFIDPNQVKGTEFTSTFEPAQVTVQDGIMRDAQGREIGYNVWSGGEMIAIPARNKQGRLLMLHGFQGEYAGQTRGFSKLAPVLQELRGLTDYTLATNQQATSQSSVTAFLENQQQDAGQVISADLSSGGAGPGSNLPPVPGGTDEGGAMVGPTYYDQPVDAMSQAGLWIQDVTKGTKVVLAKPNAPITTYDMYQQAVMGVVSAAMAMPLEMVLMRFQNNFSASRATLLLFQRIIEIVREDMVADFCNPVYEMWLSEEIAAGRVQAPGWSDPRLRAAWLKATWRGTPVPDIDPAKSAKARRENIEIGATSIERESQLHSGRSASDNIIETNKAYEGYKPMPFNAVVEAPAPEGPED